MVRKWFGAILLILVVINTALAEEGHIQEQYQLEGAGLYIDADVIAACVDALPIYRAECDEWYGYDMPSIFFEGEEYQLTYQQGNRGAQLPCYVTEEQDSLLVFTGKFVYETVKGREIYSLLYGPAEPRFVNQVPGIKANDALNMALELMGKLDIELAVEQAYIQGMSYGTGDEQISFYYLNVPFAYHAIRMMPSIFIMNSFEYFGDNGALELFITADGIEYAFVNGVYWRTSGVIDEKVILKQDEAIEAFVAYMDGMIHMDDVTITQIALEYVPMPATDRANYKVLSPVWTFYVDDYAYAHIDAVAGEVIS